MTGLVGRRALLKGALGGAVAAIGTPKLLEAVAAPPVTVAPRVLKTQLFDDTVANYCKRFVADTMTQVAARPAFTFRELERVKTWDDTRAMIDGWSPGQFGYPFMTKEQIDAHMAAVLRKEDDFTPFSWIGHSVAPTRYRRGASLRGCPYCGTLYEGSACAVCGRGPRSYSIAPMGRVAT